MKILFDNAHGHGKLRIQTTFLALNICKKYEQIKKMFANSITNEIKLRLLYYCFWNGKMQAIFIFALVNNIYAKLVLNY